MTINTQSVNKSYIINLQTMQGLIFQGVVYVAAQKIDRVMQYEEHAVEILQSIDNYNYPIDVDK